MEVKRTHLPHRQPDADEGSPGLLGIGRGASAMRVITIGAVEQTDDKLSR